MSEYGRRMVVDADFDTAVNTIRRAISDEGMHVINVFDVREHFARCAGQPFRRFAIVEAWSTDLALQALQQTLEAATMLPTRFAIYELPDGETGVITKGPFATLAENPAWRYSELRLADIADRESERVSQVLDRVRHRPWLAAA
jgi:uncharacterized protein (DUF302 family)